jgi:membrane protein YdbS with pleckstrin-like domain
MEEKPVESEGSANSALEPRAADERPHRPADDREEVYFAGSPLLRGELGRLIGWFIAALVLVAIIVAATWMNWTWWNVWFSVGLAVVAILLTTVPFIKTKTIRYRVTNYRIDRERGLFSRDIDTLELWHVEDITFHQSLIDRVLRVGTITVMSHDDTTPKLELMSVPNPRPLFESLKQRIIAVKRQRGVIKMDIG